jgi:glycosyltransferase involved in cell wall biosynthesis
VLERPFDVVHYHNPSLIGGPAVLAMGSGIKLYTAHEQWLVCPTHVLWKYQRRVCEAPHCVRCQASYRRPPQLWRATSLLERCVGGLDAIIAPSRTSAGLHQRFKGLVRIEHLPHFVPEPPIDPAPRPPAEPYLLYAGRLESIKGVEQLVRAFPSGHHRLVIAGDGSQASSLRRAAADRPEIRFTGWLDEVELRQLMAAALAVIVPTQGHESFGLVAVEAFATGTPAIVRRFGALEELAEDSGAAISYRSDAELRAAVERLAGDPDLRRRLGRRARQAYLERWTPEAHLQRYLGLIADLVESRSAR